MWYSPKKCDNEISTIFWKSHNNDKTISWGLVVSSTKNYYRSTISICCNSIFQNVMNNGEAMLEFFFVWFLQQTWLDGNILSFKCPVMTWWNQQFRYAPQKKESQPKNCIFGPQKCHFGLSEPKKGLPSGRTATYRRSEGFQSYLRIWGWYNPIKLTISETKKWGWCGRSVKKSRFWGQKWGQIGHGGCLEAPVQCCEHN